jgi:uncharacterized delta-60 repeat protein
MSRRLKLEQDAIISAGFPPVGNFYDGYSGLTFSQVDADGNLSYVGSGISTPNLNIQSVISASTVTPNSLNDLVKVTDQSGPLFLANPSGTASEGKFMRIRIKDNGSTQSLTYDTKYRAFCDDLPSTTVEDRTLYLDTIYNEIDDKWDVLHNHFQLSPTIPNFNSFMFTVQANGQTFSTDGGFDLAVHAIEIQPDGKILVGGWFTNYQGSTANGIIRLNADGSIDNSFSTITGFEYSSGLFGGVYSIALQSDGKILVGGSFTLFDGQIANRIIRLNSDGSKDNSFDNSIGFNDTVKDITIQPDGKILVGGAFTSYKSSANNRIIRLNSNGSKDTTFDNSIGFDWGSVTTMALQSDGKIMVGCENTSKYKGIACNHIIRINPNGTKDTTFDNGGYTQWSYPTVGFNSSVYSIAIQNDGKIIVGGWFTAYKNVSNNNGIIRLNSDGSEDTTFDNTTGFNVSSGQPVQKVLVQPDGKILAFGMFTTYKGQLCNRVARINSDGTFDISFNIGDLLTRGFNGTTWTSTIDNNGSIYVGGLFNGYTNQTHNNFIKLLPSGDVADAFAKFTIPTTGTGYNYTVTTSEQTLTNQTSDVVLYWSSPGTYSVEITGSFPRIYFDYVAEDKDNILEINRWGDVEWKSMERAFAGCSNLDVVATDIPNLSTVTYMNLLGCFGNCSSLINSNGSIGLWNTSNVSTMNSMFLGTPFNQSLSSWDTSTVSDMSSMFFNAGFDSEIFQDVSNVYNMGSMFTGCSITGINSSNMSAWDVTNVTNMQSMFFSANNFNADISLWETNSVTNMSYMFNGALSFNQDVGSWSVSNVTNMEFMFSSAIVFNQDLESWDVSNVTNMRGMFNFAQLFNGDITTWDTSSVTNMSYMFNQAEVFNQDLSNWDVSNVTDFTAMFQNAYSMTYPLNPHWNTISAQSMKYMFASASSYNQQISTWNVSNVTDFEGMFENAVSYNQVVNFNPSSWTGSAFTSGGVNMNNMFANSGMSVENFTDTIANFADIVSTYGGWYSNSFENQSGIDFDGLRPGPTSSLFTFVGDSKDFLTGPASWTMSGFNNAQPFEFIIDTNLGVNTEFSLPLVSNGSYSFGVDWGDNSKDVITSWNQLESTHTYETGGTYAVKIGGHLDGFSFNNSPLNAEMITDLLDFGLIKLSDYSQAMFGGCINLTTVSGIPDLSNFTSLENFFAGCSSLTNVTDINSWDVSNITSMTGMFTSTSFNQSLSNWDVSNVTDMGNMFNNSILFNQSLNNWDVSNVTSMGAMFYGASAFNGDISNWDTSNVTIMDGMFEDATSFNQNIGGWTVSNVTSMGYMFFDATSFNQDISNWDVSSVTLMTNMFRNATSFNQDISDWDISNVTNLSGFMTGKSSSDYSYYDNLLNSWYLLTLQSGVTLNMGTINYTSAGSASRANIIADYSWTITDGGLI